MSIGESNCFTGCFPCCINDPASEKNTLQDNENDPASEKNTLQDNEVGRFMRGDDAQVQQLVTLYATLFFQQTTPYDPLNKWLKANALNRICNIFSFFRTLIQGLDIAEVLQKKNSHSIPIRSALEIVREIPTLAKELHDLLPQIIRHTSKAASPNSVAPKAFYIIRSRSHTLSIDSPKPKPTRLRSSTSANERERPLGIMQITNLQAFSKESLIVDEQIRNIFNEWRFSLFFKEWESTQLIASTTKRTPTGTPSPAFSAKRRRSWFSETLIEPFVLEALEKHKASEETTITVVRRKKSTPKIVSADDDVLFDFDNPPVLNVNVPMQI